MQTKKDDSILAECSEEDFEFAPVRQIDGDRGVSNVQNHSHDDGEAHIYPVYFEVDRDETGVHVRAVECGCPADEYHSGPCKHRQTASECAELLGDVLNVALADEDSEDAGTESKTTSTSESVTGDSQGRRQAVASTPAIATDGGGMVICECGSHEIQITSSTEQRDDSGHVIKFREKYLCPVCGGTGTIRSDHGRETQSDCLTTAGA